MVQYKYLVCICTVYVPCRRIKAYRHCALHTRSKRFLVSEVRNSVPRTVIEHVPATLGLRIREHSIVLHYAYDDTRYVIVHTRGTLQSLQWAHVHPELQVLLEWGEERKCQLPASVFQISAIQSRRKSKKNACFAIQCNRVNAVKLFN